MKSLCFSCCYVIANTCLKHFHQERYQSISNKLRSTPVMQEGDGFYLPFEQNSNTYTKKRSLHFANTILVLKSMSQYQQFNLLCWQKKHYTILQSPILIFVEPIWCFPFILLLPMLVHFSSGLVMGPSCTYTLYILHTYRLESSQDLNFKLAIKNKAQLDHWSYQNHEQNWKKIRHIFRE